MKQLHWCIAIFHLLLLPLAGQQVTVAGFDRQPASAVAVLGGSADFSFQFRTPPPSGALGVVVAKNGVVVTSRFSLISQNTTNDGNFTVGSFVLRISNIAAADAGTYTFEVTVEGSRLSYGVSQPVSLTFGQFASPAQIIEQPTSRTSALGGSVTFSVVATGVPVPTYQWERNGAAISGATASTYTIPSVDSNSAGAYRVTVTNPSRTVVSNSADLVVTNVGNFDRQPASALAAMGGSADYTFQFRCTPASAVFGVVVAKGGAAVTSRFSLVSQNITNDGFYTVGTFVLRISNIVTADSGTYTFEVTVNGASVPQGVSQPVSLAFGEFAAPAQILEQPVSKTVNLGGAVAFSVVASGVPTPTYQWEKNGTTISGATASTYSISSVDSASAGIYRVTVANPSRSVISNPAELSIINVGSFDRQPASAVAALGGSADFTFQFRSPPTSSVLGVVVAKGGTAVTSRFSLVSQNVTNDGVYTVGSFLLRISNIANADTGAYTFEVTVNGSSVPSGTSQAVNLSLGEFAAPAQIVEQPVSKVADISGTVTFSVVATGAPAPTYQWQKNGIAINGATASTYTVTSVNAGSAGIYRVTVTNPSKSIVSDPAELFVGKAQVPVMTAEPVSVSARFGDTAVFSVNAAGFPSPAYQWYKNGSALPGATGSTLSIPNLTESNAGQYTAVASNLLGSVTSRAATIIFPPTITSQPASLTVNEGASAAFTVAVSSNAPLTYVWMKSFPDTINPGSATGTTSATLTFPSAVPADAGSYFVRIGNSAGFVTSNPATLTVNAKPNIVTQPSGRVYTTGDNLTLSVTATGAPALTYQWRKDGTAIPGATADTLSLANAQMATAGNYTVVVTNFLGAITSQTAALTFGVSPTFTSQPANVTLIAGQNATFTVAATGIPAPAYQWRKDGIAITGATGAALTVTNTTASDSASYTCVASNSMGRVISAAATLTVKFSARLSNISVRTTLARGESLIVGFSVSGGGKPILLRSAGPALGALGQRGFAEDPLIEIYQGQNNLAANNDWPSTLSAAFASVGAFPFPANSKDAALLQTLGGTYTVNTTASGPGLLLVEGYDTGPGSLARLTNLSARGRVGTGADILIAGFYVSGTGTMQVLIRAVGPTLGRAPYNVPATLADPLLELYDANGALIQQNDNWDTSLSPLFASVGAFALAPGTRDAAIIATLPAGGSYSAQVSGVNSTTGEALLEVYELP